MPLVPFSHTLLIYELFEVGYDSYVIAHSHPHWSTEYVRDVIAKGRQRDYIRRTATTRGRPPVRSKMNLLPKEIFMPDMVKLKNPVSGEVKLLRSSEVLKYKRYGWVPATLNEFRVWHLKQGKKGKDNATEVPNLLPRD